ncbi:hypothetical protein L6164_005951 [Bauhinia variegata]|uniref:Uncharacterized protein n=1 Tax=Bauhinia variegata TaxID=167791 RepID=A0ACB9PSS0_BAUVA|nr:hypothetical protein L6164_005951 [Bauhinia variegata]
MAPGFHSLKPTVFLFQPTLVFPPLLYAPEILTHHLLHQQRCQIHFSVYLLPFTLYKIVLEIVPDVTAYPSYGLILCFVCSSYSSVNFESFSILGGLCLRGAGLIPPPQDIEKLKSVLDGIKPEDVGVKPELPFFWPITGRRLQRVSYLHIFDCDKFSMGIFCLPPSGVIPLHNHPGMTVFSKLLFGTMHIKSYDWVVDFPADTATSLKPSSETEIQQAEVRLARVKADADFTAPCNPSILYPADGGNMHCFTAVTACAVLDVLGPPYNDAEGRHCQYYNDYPFENFSVEGLSIPEEERKGYAWLQEREKPEDLEVVGTMYNGPRFKK